MYRGPLYLGLGKNLLQNKLQQLLQNTHILSGYLLKNSIWIRKFSFEYKKKFSYKINCNLRLQLYSITFYWK